MAALQRQVNEHLSPVWGVSADVSFVPEGGKVTSDAWELFILDESDQSGALGYHELSKAGLPIGKVFTVTTKKAGESWSLVASDELLNMLADPRVNSTVFISTDASGGRLYAQEIASPCETDADAYEINGTKVSDFVFPSWFEPKANPNTTQFDQTKRASRPLYVCPGGYISVYDIKGGNWQQVTNNGL